MAATPPPSSEGWTVVEGKKKASKASKKQLSPPQPSMDQRSFELIQNEQPKLNRNEADNIVSSINRAPHREGISEVSRKDPVHGLPPTPRRHHPHLHTTGPS